MKAFEDGYTRTAGINEIANLCPAVEFTYRPLCGPEASDVLTTILTAPDKIEAKLTFLAGIILQWRFPESEDASPEWLKPTVEQLRKLNGQAFQKIEHIVMGHAAPDYLLVVGEKQNDPKSDDEQAVDDAKNLPAGSPS